MPTIFRYRGYRFFFVSYDCTEPRHVHVTKENKECKFWVRSSTNVILADSYGFSQRELNVIKKTIWIDLKL